MRKTPEAFAAEYLDALKAQILSSPYLDGTTLNKRFHGTYGFSMTFRKSAMPKALRICPAFETFLNATMEPKSNAYFLNPLLIGEGAKVEPHIDLSLGSWIRPETPPYPRKVSVLYIEVPPGLRGGQLTLHRKKPVGKIKPQKNLLVEFAGDLLHEVEQVGFEADAQPAPRISLVCEHYELNEDQLELIPEFHLSSQKSFQDFLNLALSEDHRGNSDRHFEDDLEVTP